MDRLVPTSVPTPPTTPDSCSKMFSSPTEVSPIGTTTTSSVFFPTPAPTSLAPVAPPSPPLEGPASCKSTPSLPGLPASPFLHNLPPPFLLPHMSQALLTRHWLGQAARLQTSPSYPPLGRAKPLHLAYHVWGLTSPPRAMLYICLARMLCVCCE